MLPQAGASMYGLGGGTISSQPKDRNPRRNFQRECAGHKELSDSSSSSLRLITDTITVFDPYADLFGNVVLSSGSTTKCVWPIDETVDEFDIVILAVPHRQFVEKGWALINALW